MDEREVYMEGMKYDGGKLRMSLVEPEFVTGLAEVLTYGSVKYTADSWQHLENAEERYRDALLRHLYAYLSGEVNDQESGLSHLKHISANVMFLEHFERTKTRDTTVWVDSPSVLMTAKPIINVRPGNDDIVRL